jgi:hypothetical protein
MTDPFVRVDVWTLAADDPIITAYADTVAAMMAKPISDPTSWGYQAAIHGIDPGLPLPPGVSQLLPQWNQCQHYSWYFLPWHRMFVYYFEQIVATLCRSRSATSSKLTAHRIRYLPLNAGGTSIPELCSRPLTSRW